MKSEEKNIDFQYILSTLPPQAERLYHSKILQNICSAILLIAGSLAAPAFWWVQNNYYAGHFFWWALLAQWNIVHWLASCLLTVPALVILWGKRTFWRYFLQVYPILLIIAGAAATLLWYRDDYHRMSDNILPVWMVYLIIALTSLGIVYCASSKELWGNNVFTLHQLKLLAAHQQKLTILTKEKFWYYAKNKWYTQWFSLIMILFYIWCALWSYTGYWVIGNNYRAWKSTAQELYALHELYGSQAEKYSPAWMKKRDELLLRSAEKGYLPAMLDLAYIHLWSWEDENIQQNADYDPAKGLYWLKKALDSSTPEDYLFVMHRAGYIASNSNSLRPQVNMLTEKFAERIIGEIIVTVDSGKIPADKTLDKLIKLAMCIAYTEAYDTLQHSETALEKLPAELRNHKAVREMSGSENPWGVMSVIEKDLNSDNVPEWILGTFGGTGGNNYTVMCKVNGKYQCAGSFLGTLIKFPQGLLVRYYCGWAEAHYTCFELVNGKLRERFKVKREFDPSNFKAKITIELNTKKEQKND